MLLKIRIMKSVLFIITIILSFYGFAQQANTTGFSKKGIVFVSTEIARGDIVFGSKELFVFEFRNKSKSVVRIVDVQTSCGCTTAEKPLGEIKRRGKGKISVAYDTHREGPFSKTITVTSTAGLPVVLTISGNVLPEKH